MAEPVEAKKTPAAARAHQPWARTTLWVSIVLILVGAAVFVFKSCLEAPERAVRQTTQALKTVAAAFRRGTVSTSFVSYATVLTNNLNLQIATLNQMEMFSRTESPLTGYGYVPLPDVIVEARAPVEYTYYLDLNKEWRFVLEDNTVFVLAPAIQFNKPAIDASAITYEVRRGYLKSDEALERLKRSLTSLVILRARSNVHLVRETARRQTEEFVRVWLMKSFSDGKQYPIEVRFADEPGGMRPAAVHLEVPSEDPGAGE